MKKQTLIVVYKGDVMCILYAHVLLKGLSVTAIGRELLCRLCH